MPVEKRQVYTGLRYVPKIFGEWKQTETYEGLSVVTYQGASYTSKKRVPIGIDITNTEFWVVTGNYNAQVEQYRQDVKNGISQNQQELNKAIGELEQYKKDTGFQIPLTTSTVYIQKALNENRKIVFMDGVYEIDAPIFIKSNTHIIFSPNTVLKAKKGSFVGLNDRLLNIINQRNITFSNKCKVEMNKSEYTTGEWRHGFNIQTVKGFTADVIEVVGSGGDGFYLGTEDNMSINEDVFIDTLIADNNRRNGVSIICGKNITINTIIARNTNGTLPERGVDFEPNVNTNTLENISIGSIFTENNKSGSVDFAIGQLKDTRISTTITIDAIYSKNDGMGVRAAYNNPSGDTIQLNGLIHIKQMFIDSPKRRGVDFYNYTSKCVRLLWENITVLNVGSDPLITDNFDLSGFTIRVQANESALKIGNFEIRNAVVIDNRESKRTFLPYYMNATGKNLEKINMIDVSGEGYTNSGAPFNIGKGDIYLANSQPKLFNNAVSGNVATSRGVILTNTLTTNIALNLPLASEYPNAVYVFKVTKGAINVGVQATDRILKSGLNAGEMYTMWSIGDYLEVKSNGVDAWEIVKEVSNPMLNLEKKPVFLGQQAFSGGNAYISTGTLVVADWKQVSN